MPVIPERYYTAPAISNQPRAAIDVDNAAFVPQHFRLVMNNSATVRECRIAWIQKNRIGLSFVSQG